MTRQRTAASLSFLLALGIASAALLGPLVLGVIRFHMSDLLVNQYLGGEIVSLFFVAPVLATAGVLWLRGDRLAPALALGPALYTVYTFVTAILGQDYARYPGNAEKAFPLYVALIAGGFCLTFLAGRELGDSEAREMPTTLRRVAAGLFLLIVVFFALAWSAQISLVYRGDPSTEYLDNPTLFWLIRMLDLGFLLPLFAFLGVGLLKKCSYAIRMSYGMVSFAVCMAGAILGMSVAMLFRGDPSASMGMVAFLLPITLCLLILSVRMLSVYRSDGRVSDRPHGIGMRHAG